MSKSVEPVRVIGVVFLSAVAVSVMAALLSESVFVMSVVIVESSVAVTMVVSVRGRGICCDCCRGVVLWGFSCNVCWGGHSASCGVCLCSSVCWHGRHSSHGVRLGEGDGCGVCLYGSGGHGVCWGSSGAFCQYASRGVVCWGVWVVGVTITLSVMLVLSVSSVSVV